MQPRMRNPVTFLPGAMEAMHQLGKVIQAAGVPRQTLELFNLRASQINGCAVCLDMHSRALVKLGDTTERLHTVAAWRETPYFTDAERAGLALTEAMTRLADRSDPIPDEIWGEAARHFSEKALAAIVASIAVINLYNRVNTATRQVTGPWVEDYI